MLARHRLFIFTGLLLLASVQTLNKLTTEKAQEHFFETIGRFTKHLTPRATVLNNEISKRFSVPKTREQIIDIGFTIQDVNSYVMSFTRAKTFPVIKTVIEYDTDEMKIQAAAFGELLSRMTVVTDNFKEELFFNTVSDVKQRILDLSTNPRQKLILKEDFKDNQVLMKLFCSETLLGLFEIQIDGSKVVVVEDDYKQTNYEIIVLFTISYENSELPRKIEIPMFSNNQDVFEQAISHITSKLRLAQYVNNNDENLTQFRLYILNNFKQFKFSTDEKQNTLELKQFSLSFDDQVATGNLVYNPPKANEKVGSYTISLFKGKELYKSITYKRMSNEDLQKVFAELKLDGLFEELWQKIKRVFKAKYEAKFDNVYRGTKWVEAFDRPFIGNESLLYSAHFGIEKLLTLIYKEVKGDVNLIFETQKPNLLSKEYRFTKAEHQFPLIERFLMYNIQDFDRSIQKKI